VSDSDEIDNSDKKALGQRLRALRDGLNWTLAELSQATKQLDPQKEGISTVSISRYENADSYPGYRELKLFAQAFAEPIDVIFYGETLDPFKGWEFSLDDYLRKEIRDVLREEGLIAGDSRAQRELKKAMVQRSINSKRQPFTYTESEKIEAQALKKVTLSKLKKAAKEIDKSNNL
jgi:transcriptional regulator with XRE-family HTH domain